MFVYINENFLHAPSTDLSKEVVKILVGLMGAQAVEIFIETMGPATAKGAGLRSKMCMQASSAYAGIVEDCKEWVTKGVFLKEWSLLIQVNTTFLLATPSFELLVVGATDDFREPFAHRLKRNISHLSLNTTDQSPILQQANTERL